MTYCVCVLSPYCTLYHTQLNECGKFTDIPYTVQNTVFLWPPHPQSLRSSTILWLPNPEDEGNMLPQNSVLQIVTIISTISINVSESPLSVSSSHCHTPSEPHSFHFITISDKSPVLTYLSSAYVNFISRLCLLRNVWWSSGISIFDGCGTGSPIATRQCCWCCCCSCWLLLLLSLSSPQSVLISFLQAEGDVRTWPVQWMTCNINQTLHIPLLLSIFSNNN